MGCIGRQNWIIQIKLRSVDLHFVKLALQKVLISLGYIAVERDWPTHDHIEASFWG